MSILSIESQGYDTLLAEINEKTWKQRTEQFMKRNKSEFNRDLSVTVIHQSPCLPCWLYLRNLTDDRVSSLCTCSLFSLTKRSRWWLSATLMLCSCCFDSVHKSTIYRICAHTPMAIFFTCTAQERCDSNHENNLALNNTVGICKICLRYFTFRKVYRKFLGIFPLDSWEWVFDLSSFLARNPRIHSSNVISERRRS